MKRILQILIILGLILAFTACNHDQLEVDNHLKEIPEGYVAVSFQAQIPAMTEVQTRAVDPDGLDIHNMKLFCFNSYGIFITVEYATLSNQNDQNNTGQYDAIIPSETTYIHFVANQNIGQYDLSHFAGKHEDEVLSAMEGASGMMIYWARFVKNKTSEDDIKKQLQDLNNSGGITLIRNQAKVSIKDDNWDTTHFTITGFRTTNIYAYGTVAPFESGVENGFPTSFPHDFVTLPKNTAKLSDIIDVNTAKADYIFEHENTLEDPVSVIIKGRNSESSDELYYRVLLLDQRTGEPLKVLRNHHYSINIVGKLSYGQKTFQEALIAPATNNVWVAVDDWVNHISDGTNSLGVEETHIVLNASEYAGKTYTFDYNATAKPDIDWMDGNNVAEQDVEFTYNNEGGTITVDLLDMESSVNQQSGTLILKMGQMYRKVNITVVRTMNFVPSWVSSNVYTDAGENITLKFTIPEDCPEGLFPFPVMVSVNDLDVRAASGMSLPVRTPGEVDWYGADNGLGYKYEYLVEKPGVHRLYFSTELPHNASDTEDITLEAEFFTTLTKKVNFTGTQHQITLPVYNATSREWGFQRYYGGDNPESSYQNDEYIYYLLAPQKKGAEVKFQVDLNTRADNGTLTAKNANINDEFLLFSKTLDLQSGTGYNFGANNGVIDASSSSTSNSNGRTILFYPDVQNVQTFTISTKTNKAKSADVVRLSSNKNTSNSAKNQSSVLYTGDEYRSAIFELANYHPFGFAAQISVNHGTAQGTWGVNNVYTSDNIGLFVEPVDNIELTYEPNQNVSIAFDVTSFVGSDGKEVDPFGQEFEIYIDAPMLELGNLEGTPFKDKIKKDPNKDGRFIYTVSSDRAAEKIGSIDALSSGVVRERKSIPFIKKGVTVVGDIVLSSDEEEVVFYKKIFKVTTTPMTGTIQYRETASSTLNNVPKDAFVAFIRTATNSRIGVMTITADGQYSLNLRSEYVFNWTDKIELDYKVGTDVYEYTTTLEELFKNKDVVLTKAVGTTTP